MANVAVTTADGRIGTCAQLNACKSAWVLKEGNVIVGRILVYVDDIIISSTQPWISAFFKAMRDLWDCKVSGILSKDRQMKDDIYVDKLTFLGITLENDGGTVWLHAAPKAVPDDKVGCS